MGLSQQRGRPRHRYKPAVPVHHDNPDVEMPCHRSAEDGIGLDTAYELISNELLLDGQARLNLATFVTTWMPSIAAKLMADTADKNMIDKDEYPQTAEIEARCVNILADLWNSPESAHGDGLLDDRLERGGDARGAGAEVALARADARPRASRPTSRTSSPGSNVQVCWEKFCRYWDVEPRLVPMEGDRYHLDAEQAVAHCDENTIGVVGGARVDVRRQLRAGQGDRRARSTSCETDTGLDVPLHVDAASGGFVAPFIQPELEWDFRIPRVQSINASGHKYGLVYPGVGWAIWRNKEALPQDLIFDVNYLGGHMPTFALNFSRPGSEVIAQYFMFVEPGPRRATGG